MSDNQAKLYLEAMERASKKFLRSKKTALASLQAAGIVDARGNLTSHYRPPNVRNSSKSHSRVSRVRSKA